jgi:hypothetical protein
LFKTKIGTGASGGGGGGGARGNFRPPTFSENLDSPRLMNLTLSRHTYLNPGFWMLHFVRALTDLRNLTKKSQILSKVD